MSFEILGRRVSGLGEESVRSVVDADVKGVDLMMMLELLSVALVQGGTAKTREQQTIELIRPNNLALNDRATGIKRKRKMVNNSFPSVLLNGSRGFTTSTLDNHLPPFAAAKTTFTNTHPSSDIPLCYDSNRQR